MPVSLPMRAALADETKLFFICGKIELPGYDLCLLDAEGEITWSEGKFIFSDPVYGSISAVESLADGKGDQAPQLTISLNPANGASPALLSDPSVQNSRIRIWLGAIDLAQNAVVSTPYLLFDGELDQPILSVDKEGSVELDYECISTFEKLFREDEGIRLSNSNHQAFWPGELGLSAVDGITKQVIWGPGEKITASFNTYSGAPTGFNYYNGNGVNLSRYT